MSPSPLVAALAFRQLQEIRFRADHRRHHEASQSAPAAPRARSPRIELRLAGPSDRPALARLAQLDDHASLREPALLGTLDGRPAVAMGVASGVVIADPFQRTAELVDLLRVWQRQLAGDGRRRWFRR